MKRNHNSLNAIAVMACGMMLCFESIPFVVHAGQSLDPTEQLRPTIERLLAILTEPKLQGIEKRSQRRDLAMRMAQERFDFKEMSKRVLGKTWRKLSSDEQNRFVAIFTQLLEYAYIEKIEGYSGQKILFLDQRIKGERAQVNTKVADNTTDLSVSYIMLRKEGEWMVYDIVVEGVSLVRNYMVQFKEILRKDGYASLVQQVEGKIAELEQGNG